MSQWQDPDNAVKVFDLRNSAKVAEVGEDHQQKAIYEKLENTAAIGELFATIFSKYTNFIEQLNFCPFKRIELNFIFTD